jgi:hypothetical protein
MTTGYWQPDEEALACSECCEEFTTFNRRHHCRSCGLVYCDKHSPVRDAPPAGSATAAVGAPMRYIGQRVCTACWQRELDNAALLSAASASASNGHTKKHGPRNRASAAGLKLKVQVAAGGPGTGGNGVAAGSTANGPLSAPAAVRRISRVEGSSGAAFPLSPAGTATVAALTSPKGPRLSAYQRYGGSTSTRASYSAGPQGVPVATGHHHQQQQAGAGQQHRVLAAPGPVESSLPYDGNNMTASSLLDASFFSDGGGGGAGGSPRGTGSAAAVSEAAALAAAVVGPLQGVVADLLRRLRRQGQALEEMQVRCYAGLYQS